MKIKKILRQIGIFLIPFMVSMPLTIFVSMRTHIGAFSTSFHIFAFLMTALISFVVAVFIHELGHAFAFIFQGVKVKALFVLFLGVIFGKKWRIMIDKTMLLFMGGIVIPSMIVVSDDQMFLKASKMYRLSLISAPIVTYVWLIIVIMISSMSGQINGIYWMFWTLTYTLMFTRSFLIHQGMVIGDIKAFNHLKHHPEFVILLLLQIGRQQSYDTHTAKYLYSKAETYLNQVPHIQSRSDYLMLQYVCDGYRLGYLEKPSEVPTWLLKASMKRRIPKIYMMLLPTLIYTLLLFKKVESAYKLYMFYEKHEEEIFHIQLMQHYLFDMKLSDERIKEYIDMHAMYKHTLNIPFVKNEVIKKANEVSFACNI